MMHVTGLVYFCMQRPAGRWSAAADDRAKPALVPLSGTGRHAVMGGACRGIGTSGLRSRRTPRREGERPMLQVIQGVRRAVGPGLAAAALAAVTTVGLPASPAAASVAVPAGAHVNAYAWGLNDSGQLGNGTFDGHATPLQISGLDNVRQIGGGQLFSAALLADGTVDTWGYGGQGQLGNGSTA